MLYCGQFRRYQFHIIIQLYKSAKWKMHQQRFLRELYVKILNQVPVSV